MPPSEETSSAIVCLKYFCCTCICVYVHVWIDVYICHGVLMWRSECQASGASVVPWSLLGLLIPQGKVSALSAHPTAPQHGMLVPRPHAGQPDVIGSQAGTQFINVSVSLYRLSNMVWCGGPSIQWEAAKPSLWLEGRLTYFCCVILTQIQARLFSVL